MHSMLLYSFTLLLAGSLFLCFALLLFSLFSCAVHFIYIYIYLSLCDFLFVLCVCWVLRVIVTRAILARRICFSAPHAV